MERSPTQEKRHNHSNYKTENIQYIHFLVEHHRVLVQKEEEEEVSVRIEKVIEKKVRINRKSHSIFASDLYS